MKACLGACLLGLLLLASHAEAEMFRYQLALGGTLGTTLELAAPPGGMAINATSTGTSVNCHTASVAQIIVNRIDGMPHYLISALQ